MSILTDHISDPSKWRATEGSAASGEFTLSHRDYHYRVVFVRNGFGRFFNRWWGEVRVYGVPTGVSKGQLAWIKRRFGETWNKASA